MRPVSPEDLAAELLHLALSAEPLEASLLGIPGYDALLPDPSREGEEKLGQGFEEIASRATAVDPYGLSELSRQTLDFVRHTAAVNAEAARLGSVEWTVTDLFVAPAPMLTTFLPQLPLPDEARIASYAARLNRVPRYLEVVGERHRQGIAAGRTPVARLVHAAVAQLDRVLGEEDLGGIARAGCEDLVRDVVRPAFARYRTTVLGLAEHCRGDEAAGLVHLPGGAESYQVLVRQHSSSDHSPEELHQLGLSITAALTDEYAVLGERVFATSELNAVFDRLRNDPQLRYGSREEMVEQALAAVRRAEAAAPEWFATVPHVACAVEPVPATQEAGAPPAYYLPGALDGSRQGTYFLNTASPAGRFRHTAEAFAFHEAVPGHHFQTELALRTEELPLARRVLSDTATTEGWGLYAERLADEMGLYSSDLTRLGMLTADSWRAGRLVVDTGLHALGWSRAQAVSWLTANTPMSPVDIETEVDRYIAMPGQALAYMVGRLRLQQMRADAAERLGSAFDLGQFHDMLLRAGSLPLSALADAATRWVGTVL